MAHIKYTLCCITTCLLPTQCILASRVLYWQKKALEPKSPSFHNDTWAGVPGARILFLLIRRQTQEVMLLGFFPAVGFESKLYS